MLDLNFNNGLSSSFMGFEKDIDDFCGEINAYILQFTSRSDTYTTREKHWIFSAAFTVLSGLVSSYRSYKNYTFKKNVKRTLHYILDGQRHFRQDILSIKRNLLSLAGIPLSNFKDLCCDLKKLKSDTDVEFVKDLTELMHTTADGVFHKNYILSYVNSLHQFDHDLVTHNNKVERLKSMLLMKCRNFISGLHILASNKISENILHADVLSNILRGISQYMLKYGTAVNLLYGTAVNPYYHMEIVKSFIINNILYITISFPLKN